MKKTILTLCVAVAATIVQSAMFAWNAEWESGAEPDSLALYYVESATGNAATDDWAHGTVVDSFDSSDLSGTTGISWNSNLSNTTTGGYYLVAKDSQGNLMAVGGYSPAYISYADASANSFDPTNLNPSNPGASPIAGGSGGYNFGSVAAVPEPASALLMLCGVGMLIRRRRQTA